jgi:hypothetical protein
MSSHITVILLCSKENKIDANRETFVSAAFSSANPYDVRAKVKLPWISNFMLKSFINLKMILLHPIFVNQRLDLDAKTESYLHDINAKCADILLSISICHFSPDYFPCILNCSMLQMQKH